jgi:MAC/Perforin domain.
MEEGIENMGKPLGYRGDNNYDMLGYGCDATGKYLDIMSASNQVIDVIALSKAKPGIILEDYPTSEKIEIIAGSDAHALSEKHGKKFKSNASIPSKKATFTGEFSNDSGSSKVISTKFSYAIADINIYKYHCSIKRNADIKTLQDYLAAGFKEDVEKLKTNQSAKNISLFIETYGTHVYTDIYTGGKIHCVFKSVINSENKEESVNKGARMAIGSCFGLNSEKSNETSSSDEFTEKSFSYESRGGQGNQLTGSTPPMFGEKVNLTSWSKKVSINNKHSLQLIEIGDNSLLQINELIADSALSKIVAEAISSYIDNSVPALLLPLYRFSNGAKHFYSLNKKEGVNAGLNFEGVQCYVLEPNSNFPDTVELHRFYNSKSNDHFYTTNRSEVGSASDWKYEGVACKVFKQEKPNTTQLFRLWNGKYHFYTTNLNESWMDSNSFKKEDEAIWVYDTTLV